MSRVVRISAALTAVLGAMWSSGAHAATQTTAPAAETAAADYCPVHVRAYALAAHPEELAFAIWADDQGGTASGAIVAYVNGGRYTIPFTDAVIADERHAADVPTPIVVAFAAPVQFESAYVGTLEGTTCAVHDAFIRKPLSTAGPEEDARLLLFPKRDWKAYLATASALTPLPAPAAEPEEKPACKEPYAEAGNAQYQPPQLPPHSKGFFGGSVIVKVALSTDGKPMALRIDKPATEKAYDQSALIAVAQSKFTPEIFRCKAITADVYFDAKFSPYGSVEPPMNNIPEPNVKGAHNQ